MVADERTNRTSPAARLFFPRGDGPLVTVMFATRGRPDHLRRALDSLVDLAWDPSRLEFVLKVDDDDAASVAAVDDWVASHQAIRLRTIVTPRGRGYLEMGGWVNLMADQARGDWLFCFNDDAVMLTQDWDLSLLALALPACWHICPEDVCVLFAETNGSGTSNEFFFLRRRTYELMARRYDVPYVDSWLAEVLGLVKSISRLDIIKVRHDREEVRDDVRTETDQALFSGINQLVEAGPIVSQVGDALKLLGHVKTKLAATRWEFQPDGSGWYYWRSSPGKRPLHLVVDEEEGMAHLLQGGDVRYKPSDLRGMWYPRVTGKEVMRW